jgi:hypothetical protein
MAMGEFLSQLATVIGLIAAALVIYVVVKALWAEIGPMVRLLFRRVPQPAREEDDRI